MICISSCIFVYACAYKGCICICREIYKRHVCRHANVTGGTPGTWMYTALYEGKYGHFQKSNGRVFIREETLCLFNRIPTQQRFVSGTPGAAGMHKFETSCTVWVLHTAPAIVCRVNPLP